MASPAMTYQLGVADGSVQLWTWNLTTADPTGLAIEIPEWADRTWQFGTAADTLGAAVGAIQGCNSNVDADFAPLSNAAGAGSLNALNALGMVRTVIELPRFMRPKLTTVGAGAIITVTVCIRRANPMRT